ncbi:type IV secretory system conjugative DNA transfer family protein [Gilvimarinus sp. SDUM040013]|uniref:Type IV secretory system conjugative DNA transfer family protein n=1 Tax=Gilvimarinus gilvus TaxID=3058038 RepID=A0ABU4S2M6_9GAMM|nr:type IV secretory system conjugative DNA transfer family protein [Gilvimarinus sp. SDUM040013]MDO3386624.1 type IV secretory system conjugative DNA transfer family protein [Gilvimarinus sp. SDUM040013]MDX6849489.1 type IV secretory system conjugative DNA transfer family protein [Gilvimarinus sp. SDUM040013]
MSDSNSAEIMLGWARPAQQVIGFHAAQGIADADAVCASSGHLMTIAATGSGKGVSSVIPTLLSYSGTAVVIDPKGENYAVTHKAREAMGHTVVLYDPFALTGAESCGFNPMSVLDPGSANLLDEARSLALNLFGDTSTTADPFWDRAAIRLLTTLIVQVVYEEAPACRNLKQVLTLLALPLEQLRMRIQQFIGTAPGRDFAHCLMHLDVAEKTASCIVEVARTGVGYLQSPSVLRSLDVTGFDLTALRQGQPLTLYLVVPPHKLQSHSGLLRSVLGSLCSLIVQRKASPALETLFILDEAAQLGQMPQLETAITLLRGYGVRVWTFWQDVAQLKATYPGSWPTLVNNCKVLQMFGFSNAVSVRQAEELTGFSGSLLTLNADEQLVQIAGKPAYLCRRVNYLLDAPYQGRYSPNPFYTGHTQNNEIDALEGDLL